MLIRYLEAVRHVAVLDVQVSPGFLLRLGGRAFKAEKLSLVLSEACAVSSSCLQRIPRSGQIAGHWAVAGKCRKQQGSETADLLCLSTTVTWTIQTFFPTSHPHTSHTHTSHTHISSDAPGTCGSCL